MIFSLSKQSKIQFQFNIQERQKTKDDIKNIPWVAAAFVGVFPTRLGAFFVAGFFLGAGFAFFGDGSFFADDAPLDGVCRLAGVALAGVDGVFGGCTSATVLIKQMMK